LISDCFGFNTLGVAAAVVMKWTDLPSMYLKKEGLVYLNENSDIASTMKRKNAKRAACARAKHRVPFTRSIMERGGKAFGFER